ncbi:hypothetical protein ACOSQ4_031551 [Xanthoceras sorbifolium]
MVSSRVDKGKALVSAKKPKRTLLKFTRGSRIPEEFLKAMPSKRPQASMKTSATHIPEEVAAEDVRPLKVRPSRFKEVSSGIRDRDQGEQSPSKEQTAGASERMPPPMYTLGKPTVGQISFGGPFSPENSVDFMCSHVRNFTKSNDSGVAGKIFNDERVGIATNQLWTRLERMESELVIKKDTCISLERQLGEAKEEIMSLRARLANAEALADARK